MNLFAFLAAWYNIPFSAALGCSFILALIQVLGGFGDSEAEADVDADVDIDADVDVDPDMDVDVDPDVDADSHGHGGGAGMLAALGFGKLPFLLVLAAMLGSLGALGLLANSILNAVLGTYHSALFVVVLLTALLLSLPLTRVISAGLSRLAPQSSTAVSFEQLVGRAGIVVSPHVSATYGRVSVRDGHGSLHTVFAVIERGEPIPEQSEVALLAYDNAQRRFVVRALRR